MSFAPLLRHQARRHRVVLIVMTLGLWLLFWAFTRFAPPPERNAEFAGLLSILPPIMLEALGLDLRQLTTGGILALAYAHPVTMMLMAAWVARVAGGGLAGEIGAGTMDLLASRPVKRWQVAASVALALAVGLLVLTAGAWLGMTLGLATRPLGVSGGDFIPPALLAALTFAAFGGVALLISALTRVGGTAIGWIAGVIAASYALDYLARAWEFLAPTRWITLFHYYRPLEVMSSGWRLGDTVVLLSVAVVGTALALAVFVRRDL